MRKFLLPLMLIMSSAISAQTPPIEPGVSQELARWRAARYSDVRYKLNLTLEKMSPVLRGSMEIRVKLSEPPASAGGQSLKGSAPPILLDWRKIKGHEEKSTVSNVSVNGKAVSVSTNWPPADAGGSDFNEHLIFRDGVVVGENVIKLDFTSPILTSGSAITRYVDKEDGSEYIYSLFVPSDASTAFPVFDQPDLKARFKLFITLKNLVARNVISNTEKLGEFVGRKGIHSVEFAETLPISTYVFAFAAGNFIEYFEPGAEGDEITQTFYDDGNSTVYKPRKTGSRLYVRESQAEKFKPHAAEVFRLNREAVKYFEQYFDYKFPFPKYDLVLIPEFPFGGMEHAGATFLRESSIIFPQEPTKNDLVNRATLIFHEAAHQWFGDTVTMRWFDDLWLKEGFATFTAYKALEKIMPEMNSWKVFYERIKQGAYQTDSTRGTTAIYQPIANLSAAKSAYGNIVYNKAPAFLRQAEFYLGEDKFRAGVRSFLKRHEFSNAGWEDLVRELAGYKNSHVEEFVRPFVTQSGVSIIRFNRDTPAHKSWEINGIHASAQTEAIGYEYSENFKKHQNWGMDLSLLLRYEDGDTVVEKQRVHAGNGYLMQFPRQFDELGRPKEKFERPFLVFPNYQDYGYGIFLLDEKSRDYVLKNIQNEKDPFLRAMMWGALWDSVREGELDPRVFVELVVKVLGSSSRGVTTPSAQSGGHPSLDKEGSVGGKSYAFTREAPRAVGTLDGTRAGSEGDATFERAKGFTPEGVTLTEEDESTVATLLGRTGTALNYYMSVPPAAAGGTLASGMKTVATTTGATDLRGRVEDLLIERMRNAPTLGQRITYYRAFLNIAASVKARGVLKELLATGGNLSGSEGAPGSRSEARGTLPTGRVTALGVSANAGKGAGVPLKTKDKFDIVTRLLILGDPEGEKLLAELEKTETSDDAKRYAYAAKAGIGTAENKAKYWNDFVSNKEISESWIEAAFGPWNSIRHSDLTLPYLERAFKELPNHKRNRKIFFVNGWLGAFIGGQRSAEALAIVNKFLGDNPGLDNDLRLKILENVDLIERAVNIRRKFPQV